MSPQQIAQAAKWLADPDAFTTTLLTVLIEAYGTEAIAWAPETILMELQDDFNVQLPKVNMDKLVVGISLLTSDDFYRRPSRFVQMCNVLAGSELSAAFDRADAVELAWGMTEAVLLAPPEPDDENPFSNEIRAYIGQVLAEEGVHNPPDLLQLGISPHQYGSGGGLDAEDPEMFAAQYGIRADRSAEIKEMLEDNLQELLQQVATFSGSTKDELLKRMRQGAA
jgi:hypothetical protein